MQRWLTPDPIGLAGGLNLYGFVGNNPVNFVDPHGLLFREFFEWLGDVLYDSIMDTSGGGDGVYNPNTYAYMRADLLGTGDEGQILHDVVKETVATAGDVGTDQLPAAGVGKAIGASFAFFCKLKRSAKTVAAEVTTPIGELRAAGLRDAHHVVQDSAVRDLPGYDTQLARGVQLPGPPTAVGTPHHAATRVQRQAGGGTLGAELRIGYKALRRAGCSEAEARQAIAESEAYFNSIGATRSTPTPLIHG